MSTSSPGMMEPGTDKKNAAIVANKLAADYVLV